MDALDTALGRKLRYAVVAPTGVILRDGEGTRLADTEPPWAARLREASGMM